MAEPNLYELARDQRIADNKARLEAIGLLKAAAEFNELTKPQPPKPRTRGQQADPPPRKQLNRSCKRSKPGALPEVVDPGAADPSYSPHSSEEEPDDVNEDSSELLGMEDTIELLEVQDPGWSKLIKEVDG